MRRTKHSPKTQTLHKPNPTILRNDTNPLLLKESDIQKSFYNRVKIKQLYNQYPCEFFLFATCNEHLGGQRYIKHLMLMGMQPGVLDQCVLMPNKPPAFMECKKDSKQKLRPSQTKFTEMCDRFGFEWTVYWDVEQADEWLVDYLRRNS